MAGKLQKDPIRKCIPAGAWSCSGFLAVQRQYLLVWAVGWGGVRLWVPVKTSAIVTDAVSIKLY